jgi:hypothetical protein
MFVVRTMQNTQMHFVGTMQSFSTLKVGGTYRNYWILKG